MHVWKVETHVGLALVWTSFSCHCPTLGGVRTTCFFLPLFPVDIFALTLTHVIIHLYNPSIFFSKSLNVFDNWIVYLLQKEKLKFYKFTLASIWPSLTFCLKRKRFSLKLTISDGISTWLVWSGNHGLQHALPSTYLDTHLRRILQGTSLHPSPWDIKTKSIMLL